LGGRQLGEGLQQSPLKNDISSAVEAEDGGWMREERAEVREGPEMSDARPVMDRFETARKEL